LGIRDADELLAEFTPDELDKGDLENLPAALSDMEVEGDRAAEDFACAEAVLRERSNGLGSVAEAEEELERAKEEHARIQELDKTLELTREFLKKAQDRVHRSIAPVLSESVQRRLPEVTSGRYRGVRVDPETLDVQVLGEGGTWRRAALLSHGTSEQIYLLLRVALAEHLVKEGEVCPLLLDESTVHCDSERKIAVLNALRAISRKRQVILFTQEVEVLNWAEKNLEEPQDRIIRLTREEVDS
jgi:uncharacterized protein YhaN